MAGLMDRLGGTKAKLAEAESKKVAERARLETEGKKNELSTERQKIGAELAEISQSSAEADKVLGEIALMEKTGGLDDETMNELDAIKQEAMASKARLEELNSRLAELDQAIAALEGPGANQTEASSAEAPEPSPETVHVFTKEAVGALMTDVDATLEKYGASDSALKFVKNYEYLQKDSSAKSQAYDDLEKGEQRGATHISKEMIEDAVASGRVLLDELQPGWKQRMQEDFPSYTQQQLQEAEDHAARAIVLDGSLIKDGREIRVGSAFEALDPASKEKAFAIIKELLPKLSDEVQSLGERSAMAHAIRAGGPRLLLERASVTGALWRYDDLLKEQSKNLE